MNDQIKVILLEQAKLFGIKVLEIAGNALLETAQELGKKRLTIDQQD